MTPDPLWAPQAPWCAAIGMTGGTGCNTSHVRLEQQMTFGACNYQLVGITIVGTSYTTSETGANERVAWRSLQIWFPLVKPLNFEGGSELSLPETFTVRQTSYRDGPLT